MSPCRLQRRVLETWFQLKQIGVELLSPSLSRTIPSFPVSTHVL